MSTGWSLVYALGWPMAASLTPNDALTQSVGKQGSPPENAPSPVKKKDLAAKNVIQDPTLKGKNLNTNR